MISTRQDVLDKIKTLKINDVVDIRDYTHRLEVIKILKTIDNVEVDKFESKFRRIIWDVSNLKNREEVIEKVKKMIDNGEKLEFNSDYTKIKRTDEFE